jgi:hypothetical protein
MVTALFLGFYFSHVRVDKSLADVFSDLGAYLFLLPLCFLSRTALSTLLGVWNVVTCTFGTECTVRDFLMGVFAVVDSICCEYFLILLFIHTKSVVLARFQVMYVGSCRLFGKVRPSPSRNESTMLLL